MPMIVQWPTSSALVRRLEAIQRAAKPRSRASTQVRNDIRIIVGRDHIQKMERGVDRYGKPRAPLAESTLKNKKRGSGPSLIPHNMRSRFITNFQMVWETVDGMFVLVCKFVGIVNKQGQSFAQYHLTGASKPGTKWVLPKRDVSGITPAGWSQIVRRHSEYAATVLKGEQ